MKIEPKPNNIKDLVRLQTHFDPPASDVKPIGVWGIALVIVVLALVALALVWFKGAWVRTPLLEDQKSASLWILGALTTVLMLTLFCTRLGALRAIGAVFERETGANSPQHIVDDLSKHDAELRELRAELRTHFGWRWRYRLPWLLLTGNDDAIGQLVPELTEHRWFVTQDIVLLWSRTDANQQPDAAWLRQLYKLRRRRPVDAIVLTLDGTAELSTQRRGTNAYSVTLARIADTLRWSAPVYVLDVAQTDSVTNGATPVIGCECPRVANTQSIEAALLTVRNRLADRGVAQLSRNGHDRYSAELSERLDTRSAPLANWIMGLADRRRHQPPSGVFFAPYPLPIAGAKQPGPTSADLPLWRHLGEAARGEPAHRIGWHPVTVFSTAALTAIGVWTAGMVASGLSNTLDLRIAGQAAETVTSAPDSASRLHALLTLQQQIDLYENRTQHHAPLLTRFGLNRDQEVLAALWTTYSQTSKRVLITPVQQNLEARLADLSQMQTTQLDDQTSRLALDGHQALKTYLMMATPSRADAAFMGPLLPRYWTTDANLSTGEKLDLSERLLGFYAQHLKAHENWRIQPRADLVAASRQTLLAVIGVRNSEDTIYQGILTTVGNKYATQTLASLTAGTDTRGLIHSTATVPGVFTRQAYEGTIAAAIDKAAKRGELSSDWVLTDGQNIGGVQLGRPQTSTRPADTLKAELERRYFADYADHWQGFMNTLQWKPSTTLPSAIDQLKLMADARQSPVIALMKSIEYQGGAGAPKESLSDTLVTKAQNIFASKTEAPAMEKPDPAGPLSASFGPVLRLVAQGNADAAANSDLSLQRFMERVTALRLKLQQISDSPNADAQARQVAQSLFQGKGSALADTQAYSQLIAASLGAQWAGMGDALFVQPVTQASQTVLLPAQASLNDAWRQTIVTTWNRSFAGRYPFANTDNDASLPEFARFLRPQGGLIGAFLGSQLAGVLELQGDQWVPAATHIQALAFDPAFLKAINTLQRIAGHLLAAGEPQYRFEFKPMPTPGVTDTLLTLDGQKLHYYNQQETWQTLTWPSNSPQDLGTRLEWQTEKAGTSKNFEFTGRWGLVRMLERARVEPIDSATYQLTWQGSPDSRPLEPAQANRPASVRAAASPTTATGVSETTDEGIDDNAQGSRPLTAQGPLTPASADLAWPLSYLMLTDVAKGPLELLALRGFVLPTRIFAGKSPAVTRGVKKTAQADGLPPLPKAMLDAAKHAETPLPGGSSPL